MEDFAQEELKKLITIFTEEATEKISEFEEGILRLEREPENRELINRIFRAVHTIKGTSASLGFMNISEFTHRVEEVLDLLRKERLKSEKRIIDILLSSADIIKRMIQRASGGYDYDLKGSEAIIEELEDIKKFSIQKLYKIIFSPDPAMLSRGIDPAMIIEDLKSRGRIVNIKAYTDAVPVLSELDPEKLYLRWDILLETEEDLETLRSYFSGLGEEEIKIIPAIQPKDEVPFIGEFLIESGAVSERDVIEALDSQKKVGELLLEKGKLTREDIEKAVSEQTERRIDSFKQTLTSTVRVDLRKLDRLLNLVGEMVIIHSMLERIIYEDNGKAVIDYPSFSIQVLFNQLQRIGRQIQESTMALRMLPVGEIFHRFKRLVRELSQAQNKKVDLIISGEDTELDKGVLEKITDPLVHLIRNAIDHGIEHPEERISKGKPETGIISLSAYQVGDSIYIEVEDDGRGIDRERIVEKARHTGLIKNPDDLTEEQIYNLIFLPGFSTAEKVTDLSGRGVGMDVVKKNVESLNGRIYIRTKKDTGTTITIKLPLTLAIIDGLTVSVGDEIYIIPLQAVLELLSITNTDLNTINEKTEFLHVRGEEIPVIRLGEILGINGEDKDRCIAIVTFHEGKKFALLVDSVIGQQQIVVKNFGGALPRIKGIGGCTILGDGRVALVLDMAGLIENEIASSAVIT
ncbi:MAG: chemotaxis protein CheA [Thermodesulfovibrionales bacterium]|nr:chemotaxis protein CheA [Thermodesulfovibrionales bacterium]